MYAGDQLIFALDLIRHGDRTPLHEIPASPHIWKRGAGELTQKGEKQAFKLGQTLRQRYIQRHHLLPDQCDPALFYVRTTDRRRTIMSADALLHGLYPADKRKSSCRKIIPEIFPRNRDTLLSVKPGGNIFLRIRDYMYIHKRWQDVASAHKDDIRRWSRLTGMDIDGFFPLIHLADALYIRQLHHIPLPQGIDQEDVRKLEKLSHGAISAYFRMRNVYCPTGTAFIKTITEAFRKAEAKLSTRRWILYSAHDSSIMAVMSMLGAPLNVNPPYASDLNFSLFTGKPTPFVTIRLNGKPVYVPACAGYRCTLEQLAGIHC